MFEREIRDLSFIGRWGIVRTIRKQTVAEHSFNVCFYANDIASYLKYPDAVHKALLQFCIYHDLSEVFSGDIPGPHKRALVTDRPAWDDKLEEWTATVFIDHHLRNGSDNHGGGPVWDQAIRLTTKVADWLDAALEMATEKQMGNGCVADLVTFNTTKTLETVDQLADVLLLASDSRINLRSAVRSAVAAAANGHSRGPWIAS